MAEKQTDIDALICELEPKNRLDFLRNSYFPGNMVVAEHILAIDPCDSSVIGSEIAYAKQHGGIDENNGFIEFGKNIVDHYIEGNYGSRLEDEVKKMGDSTIADYVLAQVPSNLKKGKEKDMLSCAVRIAEYFNKEEEKLLLEKLSEHPLDGGESSSVARTYARLGLYGKAIDFYIKSDFGWPDALDIAKKYVTKRRHEAAQNGFDSYTPSSGAQEVYLECARILGKEEEAKNVLTKEAENSDPAFSVYGFYVNPEEYKGLIKSLLTLNLRAKAENVIAKLTAYERKECQYGYFDLDRKRGLAMLCRETGRMVEAEKTYLDIIDTLLGLDYSKKCESDILHLIKEGYELTGSSAILEKKLPILEKNGEYDEAARVAAIVGNHELSERYDDMHQMVEEAKSRREE